MFGFLIKKSFCDSWDHLFLELIVNSIFVLTTAACGLLGSWLITSGRMEALPAWLQYVIFGAALALFFIFYSVIAMSFGEVAAEIADFNGTHILDFFKNIPHVLKDACLFGLLNAGITIVSFIGIPWYFTQGTYFYFFLGGVFLWVYIFVILAFQWFIPIRSLMKNSFKKCLKKCFILTLDNTIFTIGMALYSLIMIICSVIFMGLIPSLAGIQMACTDALRLRLYKYDYLELHPELQTKRDRRKIPWEELIYEDRETLGPRKLKSFIFPWKE